MGAQQCCAPTKSMDYTTNISRGNKVCLRKKYGGIDLELTKGILNYEGAEAIVLVVNNQLEVTDPITKKIIKQAGKHVVNMFLKTRKLIRSAENGTILHIHTNSVEFKYIFLAVMGDEEEETRIMRGDQFRESYLWLDQFRNQDLNLGASQRLNFNRQYVYESVQACLKLGEQLKVMSIAFPILQNGKNHSNQTQSGIATMMALGIKDYLKESSVQLRQISICVNDDDSAQIFLWTLKRCLSESFIASNLESPQTATNRPLRSKTPSSHYQSNIVNSPEIIQKSKGSEKHKNQKGCESIEQDNSF